MNDSMIGLPAQFHRAALFPRRPAREHLASALVALVARLAPAIEHPIAARAPATGARW